MIDSIDTTANTVSNPVLTHATFTELLDLPPRKTCRIAIGGGKGGVGKTCLALLFAIFLSQQKKNVVLIDTDLSGPNLHRILGILNPEPTLLDFMSTEQQHLRNLLSTTSLDNFKCIFNKNGSNITSIFSNRKNYFYQQVNELAADYVIFDISAKISEVSLEFFLNADYQLLVTNNEVTSIQQNFNFLKYCTIHQLKKSCRDTSKIDTKDIYFESGGPKDYRTFMQNLLDELKCIDPVALEHFQKKFKKFKPFVIFNMSEAKYLRKQEMAFKLAVKEILDIELISLGALNYVPGLRKALRTPNPLVALVELMKDWSNFSDVATHIFRRTRPAEVNQTFRQRITKLSENHLPFGKNGKTTDIICSNKCFYWDKCQRRCGGYRCRVKYIGFLNQRKVI